MDPLRILLVDNHVLFRKGVASLMSNRQDMVIVGEASDGIEAVTIAEQTRPDIILMDVNMPKQGGLETLKRIRQKMPDVQVVMLTVSEDDDDLFEAIKHGAKGYLLKNLSPQELFSMIIGLKEGEAAISRSMASKILGEFNRAESEEAQAEEVDTLTPRERDVLEELVKGCTNKEIAKALHITENTVKIHIRNILDKLHVRNRIQAAVHAVRKDLVDEEDMEGDCET